MDARMFRQKLQSDYSALLRARQRRLPEDEVLRIDLHCHDYNSNVPDELWGRILRLPETWLKTKDLMKCLRANGADLATVTNHNNARSCWELLDQGYDVLPGAEYTCHFPDADVSVHVLIYGFDPLQEVRLNKLRKDIFQFLAYARKEKLPTVLPHPLYFYSPKIQPGMELFEKFALLFERFEVLNGQRDLWQNILVAEWLTSLTPEKIDSWSRKHKIDPHDYCRDPYTKHMVGGSDDHMGLFAGSCGTLLHIQDLENRLRGKAMSTLAREALWRGEMAPYGTLREEEKLNVAFLDYFCQIVMNMEDPGLVRMFLHKGTLKDKMMCLAISNGILELRRHKDTRQFLKCFHDALNGKRPGFVASRLASADMKPMLAALDDVARARKIDPDLYLNTLCEALPRLTRHLNGVVARRVSTLSIANLHKKDPDRLTALIKGLEIPAQLRQLFQGENHHQGADMSRLSLSEIFGRLSFPTLASVLLTASNFTSSKVLYQNRQFLNEFAGELGRHEHPKRILWLTDTFHDKNGVSISMQLILEKVRERGLPIDFLVCSKEIVSADNLHVIEPIGQFTIAGEEQVMRIPNLLEIQHIFRQGGYDRLICSTELVMGLAALFLQKSFRVPAYFYLHTDWLEFFEKRSELDIHSLDRIRRILRAFYKQFEGIFVLNSDHRDWLSGPSMGIPKQRVMMTAHWVDPYFAKEPDPGMVDAEGQMTLLYAGRISEEKGVMSLPQIYRRVAEVFPNVRMVIAGTGPALNRLQAELPEGRYLGWVDKKMLREIYAAADLFVFPSSFDTFGNVVLEALSQGLPVAALKKKGPKDLIEHRVSGYLAKNVARLADYAVDYLGDRSQWPAMRKAALARSRRFRADDIIDRLLRDLGLAPEVAGHTQIKTRITLTDQVAGKGFFEEILELVNVE